MRYGDRDQKLKKVDNFGEKEIDFVVPLGLYTAIAERVLSDAIELLCNTKIFRGNEKIFSPSYGTFGLDGHNAYLDINDYGELSVRVNSMKNDYIWSKVPDTLPRPTDPDFQKHATEILKNAVIGFLGVFKAKQLYNPDKKEPENVIKACEAFIKHFDGEELTNEEQLWIGHPMNPFEYAGYEKILEENKYSDAQRSSKIRAHLKKVQGA